ncbi:ABC transporter ATP-binding protein [Idiomarina loihiensis]|jgi:putative ABC transport system ATP-binding protein|uniref:ABC-type transport system, ATPase component n=1 Tax=Idiomarina loihiensis (strain ATCC BAA-735 / DSM 15497 / L2-TR) TaxID=283942 RepID=Q5QUF8_IDILO|nr:MULTISPECIES: ABC transporter ATP-binding protein [Idiomarina]AAV82890.1 ABC-type transport system, ATPase component [Idiomarina loihiensis L2TR]AGM36933.1 ABC transporter ATPase [Idiomarina loihiensis GSL 199]NWO03480.1 ABC transporter ATP-binding protein [Idiomarinaceae bacterium]
MITLTNLSKIFRTELIETHALREVNLQVNEGEFVALTGPSGSGKSTLLNILGTLEGFDSGDYLLDGQSVKGLSDSALSQLRNEKIGFIFQSFNLIKDFSIYDNIELPLRYRGLKAAERKQRIEQALELVGLHARRDYLPAQLSGGQQQRVAIARAIAGQPRILLADEPTGNLDSLMARQVMELLEKINQQGCTILMVTHDPDQARRAARNIQIVDGQLHDSTLYEPLAAHSA